MKLLNLQHLDGVKAKDKKNTFDVLTTELFEIFWHVEFDQHFRGFGGLQGMDHFMGKNDEPRIWWLST